MLNKHLCQNIFTKVLIKVFGIYDMLGGRYQTQQLLVTDVIYMDWHLTGNSGSLHKWTNTIEMFLRIFHLNVDIYWLLYYSGSPVMDLRLLRPLYDLYWNENYNNINYAYLHSNFYGM